MYYENKHTLIFSKHKISMYVTPMTIGNNV